MTTKQITIVHNFIISQQNHWCFYIVAYLLFCVTQQSYRIPGLHLVIWFVLGFLPYLFYKIKSKCKNKIIHFAVYFLVMAGIFFMPSPHETYTYIYLICAGYYCVVSAYYGFAHEDSEDYKSIPIVVIFIMTFMALFILQYIRLFEYQRGFLYLLIWNLVLYCISSYVDKYVKYLAVNRHSIGYMPIREVLTSGIIAMIGFSGIVSVILLIVANIGYMGDVLQYIVKFIRFLSEKCRELIRKMNFNLKMHEFDEVDIEDSIGNGFVPVDVADKFSVWDIIFSIVVVIILFVVAIKIIKFLYILLKNLLDFRPTHGEGEEEDIQEKIDVVERLDKKKRESFFDAMSPAQRIRRRYKRKILNEQDIIVSADERSRMELYTARECSDILTNSELGSLYEKARYSPYECTADDVKRMKNACKNI